ncbi:hypothetical protein [Oleispirillum naphthae]|uniref:hypothetical protein n=1 Tax=Oleispirillum naphthae TaxID=2838853 RepID=UPI0030826AF2
MKQITTDFAKTAQVLDDVVANTADVRRHIDASETANRTMAAASDNLKNGSTRIAAALSNIAEDGARLRTAEARLSFENARLKRSGKGIRASLDRLREAGEVLNQRAREAREVAEFADRTEVLITQIDACMRRGEPVEHLVAACLELAKTPHAAALRRIP